MNKKLIITEEQYQNLKFFLLESTFVDLANKVIKKDDIVTIITSKKKLNFKVFDNYGGQIYMDNTADDSRIFLDSNSFQNNKLSMGIAEDDTQKNEKPLKGKTWSKMTLQNVEKIDVYRDGNIIDGTQYEPKSERRKLDFIDLLSTLNDGDSLKLKTEGKIGDIILDFLNKSSGFVHFELSEKTKNALGNTNISSIDISTDKDMIEVDENGFLTISVITYETKDGSINKRQEKIKNIKDYGSLDVRNDDEDIEDDSEDDIENDLDAKKIYAIINGDAELKNAFYKRPSFWKSFIAELKGEKPKTTGYVLVKNIIDNFMDDKSDKKLGKNFIKNSYISFRPLDKILIRYIEDGKNRDYRLNVNQVIDNMKYVGSKPSEDSDYYKLLKNENIDIIVKEKTNTPNVYLCDIIKKYKERVKTRKGTKLVTKYSKPLKDITIEFIDSLGYRVDKEINK